MMKNSVLYPITNRYRMALSLDGMWQFQFDPKSCGLAENWKTVCRPPFPCRYLPASLISSPAALTGTTAAISGIRRIFCA